MHIFNYTNEYELNRSLRNTTLAYVFGMVFFSAIQGTAYTAFIRAINKQDSLYGFLAALPLIAGLFRFVSAYVIERFRARRMVFMISFFVQRLIWIPFALIPYLIPGTSASLRVAMIVLCLAAHGMGGAFGDVAFISWLTDLVPSEMRGSYLGRRGRIAQIAAIITPLLIGWYLDAHHGFGSLSTVLIVASLFGTLDITLWLWVRHPPLHEPAAPKTRLLHLLLEPLHTPAYRRLLAFWTSVLFAFGFMGPFLMVYNLEVLRLDYIQSSIQLQVIPGVTAFLMAGIWGRCIDQYGSKPLLKLCTIVSSCFPVFWILSTPALPWLQIIPNICSGAVWLGLDMAQMSLMMKILPKENRSFYIAGYGVVAWLAGNAVAAMLAGCLADITRPWVAGSGIRLFGAPLSVYQVLFALSMALRLVSYFTFLPRVHEPEAQSASSLISSVLAPARRVFRGRNQ